MTDWVTRTESEDDIPGIRAAFDVPDEALMSLALDSSRPVPHGTIEYPPACGV
ncbi:hypothetical protein [Gordonia jinghuaiqii]|uniref:hypothetical protein n=1 Tax=Gordonia jinghuaiqii TaxID=2758710 RepID=UPI001FD62DF9|nr:hypothetical protein [Gordonia jinghuaiqii]